MRALLIRIFVIVAVALGFTIPSTPAVLATPENHSSSLAAPTPVNGRMTHFDPHQHGFQFSNNFATELRVADVHNFRWDGLCGGMSYTGSSLFQVGYSE